PAPAIRRRVRRVVVGLHLGPGLAFMARASGANEKRSPRVAGGASAGGNRVGSSGVSGSSRHPPWRHSGGRARGGSRGGGPARRTGRGTEVLLARVGKTVAVRPGRLVLRAPLDELALRQGIDGPLLGLLLGSVAGLAGAADPREQVGLGRGQ